MGACPEWLVRAKRYIEAPPAEAMGLNEPRKVSNILTEIDGLRKQYSPSSHDQPINRQEGGGGPGG